MVCNEKTAEGMDIPLGSLVQLVLMNDDDILSSRTLWSEPVLELARSACLKNLNLDRVLMALREEAIRRGVNPMFPLDERRGDKQDGKIK